MNHLLTVEKNNKNKRFDKHNSLKKIPDKQIARFLLRSCHPHCYCIHRRFDSFLQKKCKNSFNLTHCHVDNTNNFKSFYKQGQAIQFVYSKNNAEFMCTWKRKMKS